MAESSARLSRQRSWCPSNLGLRLGVLVAGIVLFFLVGTFAVALGSGVGVIATSLLALLGATLVVGGSVVVVQDRKAPEVFWYKESG